MLGRVLRGAQGEGGVDERDGRERLRTGAPLPPGVTEGSSVQGPSFESPVSLRCTWAAHPDVVVTDPVPLLGLVLVVLLAVAAALVVLLLGRRTGSDR